MRALLFDVGGTNLRVGVAGSTRDFRNAAIVPTPKRFADGIVAIRSWSKKLSRGRAIDVAVGGLAGTLSKERGMLINSPHLPQWVGKPFKRLLARSMHAPVVLENDADLVGLGEAAYGAARRYRIVAYLTVSTGVGGTRIVDRRLDAVSYGFEPGHMVVDPNGPTYHTMRVRGVLESMVSGTAIRRIHRRHPREVTSAAVWRQQAQVLAYGLVNVTVMWSPEVIVLGGSMFKIPGIDVGVVRRELSRNLKGFLPPPDVVRGTLGDIGGLYGALHLATSYTRTHALPRR